MTETTVPVIVVRVPELKGYTLEQIRLDTIDAIRSGVWVIPQGITWSVEQLPALADAVYVTEREDNTKLKRRTLQRLLAYREENGLGCLAAVAKSAKHKGVTVETLRCVISDALELDHSSWRAISRALDRLTEKENCNEQNDMVKT